MWMRGKKDACTHERQRQHCITMFEVNGRCTNRKKTSGNNRAEEHIPPPRKELARQQTSHKMGTTINRDGENLPIIHTDMTFPIAVRNWTILIGTSTVITRELCYTVRDHRKSKNAKKI